MNKHKIVTITNCFATNEVLIKTINSMENINGVFIYISKLFNKYTLIIKKGKSKQIEYTVDEKKIYDRLSSEINNIKSKRNIDLAIVDIDLLDNKILLDLINDNINALVSFPIKIDFNTEFSEETLIRQLNFVDSINIKGKLIGAALSEEATLKTIMESL